MNIAPLEGDIVYTDRDAMGNIFVLDTRKHRVLSFDSIFEQSKMERSKPGLPVHEYNRAMLLPLAFMEPLRQPRRALVLGLGGGVMTHALHRMVPECQIDVAELRRKVVMVAHEFFGLPQKPQINIQVTDGRAMLEASPEHSTDLIFADLYNADRMSAIQSKRSFVRMSSRALTDSGWLVANYHRVPEPGGIVHRAIRNHFATVLTYTSKSRNTVIFATRQTLNWPVKPRWEISNLERRLPIGWKRLLNRLQPLD